MQMRRHRRQEVEISVEAAHTDPRVRVSGLTKADALDSLFELAGTSPDLSSAVQTAMSAGASVHDITDVIESGRTVAAARGCLN